MTGMTTRGPCSECGSMTDYVDATSAGLDILTTCPSCLQWKLGEELNESVSERTADRFNQGKVDLTLIPYDAEESEARVWMMGEYKMLGKRFTRLKVIEFIGKDEKHSYWKCKCICGNIVRASRNNLLRNNTKSCGCLVHTYKYSPQTGLFYNRKGISRDINRNGYSYSSYKGKAVQTHRLAVLLMKGKFPEKGLVVDHINSNRSDNRWCNLRVITQSENLRASKNNKRYLHLSGEFRRLRKEGLSYNKISCITGVSRHIISKYVRGIYE